MMSAELMPQLRVTARSRSFRRAGMAFGPEAISILLASVSASAVLALVTEAELICEIGDGETFQRVDPAQGRLVAMLEKLREVDPYGPLGAIVPDGFMSHFFDDEFMTGQAEGGSEPAPTLQPIASTASGAAAATGDDTPKTETGGVAAGAPEGTQPAADSAPATVAASASPADEGVTAPSPSAGKPSGRAPKAAKPKASEAKAAS